MSECACVSARVRFVKEHQKRDKPRKNMHLLNPFNPSVSLSAQRWDKKSNHRHSHSLHKRKEQKKGGKGADKNNKKGETEGVHYAFVESLDSELPPLENKKTPSRLVSRTSCRQRDLPECHCCKRYLHR